MRKIKTLPVYFIFLLIISTFLIFFRLGTTSLTNWDEAWFASVARSMIQTGDFLNGTWDGGTWFYEPPLLTWILAAILKVTQSSFALRFFSALCGVTTIVVTYLLTKELIQNRLAPLLSSLILLSNIEFLFRGRTINSDIPLTVFLVLALYTLIKTTSTKRPGWLLFAGISFGLAFLTKRASPLLALPSISILLFVFRHQITDIKRWWLTLLVFLLIIIPWHAVNLVVWGSVFVRQYFVSFTWQRIAVANPTIGTSVFFYLEALKHAFKLWTPLIFGGFVWLFIIVMLNLFQHLKPHEIPKRGRNNLIIKYLSIIVFVLTYFFAMTLSAKKASWYILPIHPFLAIAGGIFLSNILIVIPGLTRNLYNKNWIPAFAGMIWFGILVLVTFQLYHWRFDYIVPDTTAHQAALATKVKDLTKPGDTIYLDDDYLPVAVFYSERMVIPLRFNRLGEQTNKPLEIPSGSFVLTNTETIELLKSRLTHNTIPVYQIRDLLLLKTL